MTTTTASPPADKAALRDALERTSDEFRQLIAQIPDDKWHATSGNTAFTCGQLAWHIASGLDFSAGLIEAARDGKQTNLPAFIMPLAYKINEFRIKRSARNATRDSVLADYDREHARLIALLDQCTDADLNIVKTNYAITRTVRQMFENPIEHIQEHAPEIRTAL